MDITGPQLSVLIGSILGLIYVGYQIWHYITNDLDYPDYYDYEDFDDE